MIARIEQDIQNANASIETKKADIENAKLETTKNEEAISNFEQEIEKIKSEVTNSSDSKKWWIRKDRGSNRVTI